MKKLGMSAPWLALALGMVGGIAGGCDTGADTLVAPPDTAEVASTPDTSGADSGVPDATADASDGSSKPDTAGTCPGAPGCVCLADKDCPGSACLATESGRR